MSWGVVREWRTAVYEPELIAFGGPEGMALTHQFFHADSLGVLDYLNRLNDGAHGLPDSKTTSLLGMSTMLRAVGLELGEQGDVWGRVEKCRPLAPDVDHSRVSTLIEPMHRLLLTDPRELLANGGSLESLRPWFDAMDASGRALAEAVATGKVTSGIRAIAARRVLFHWNRMGFHTNQQALWASVARQAALDN